MAGESFEEDDFDTWPSASGVERARAPEDNISTSRRKSWTTIFVLVGFGLLVGGVLGAIATTILLGAREPLAPVRAPVVEVPPAPPVPGPVLARAPLPVAPKVRPPQPLEIIAQPSIRVLVDTPSSAMWQLLFSSQSSVVGFKTPGGRAHFFDWKNGKPIVNIEGSAKAGAFASLSPKGTRFLMHQYTPFALNIWSIPSGEELKRDWRPTGVPPDELKGNFDRAGVAWAAFLDNDQLLTIAASGRFDLWEADLEKTVYTVPARKPQVLSVNGFSGAPQNLALSRDRTILALSNGDGFDFFDVPTGNPLGKTETMSFDGKATNLWGVDFSKDGTSLAARFILRMPGNDSQEVLAVWNVADGKRKHLFLLEKESSLRGAVSWLTEQYLVVWDGNLFSGAIFDLEAGRFVRRLLKSSSGGIFGRDGPDDRLWFASGVVNIAPAQILAVEIPFEDLRAAPAEEFEFGNLPRWFISTNGLSRNQLTK